MIMITPVTTTITSTTIMDDYVLRAVAAAVGIVLIAGPLGCFVVWRRMAYFGDTLSHAALAGVALGFLLGIDLTVGVVATGVFVGLALLALQSTTRVPTDTLLGILSHAALAVGMIVVSLLDNVRIDLMAYLFGDILAVTSRDVVTIYIGAVVVLTTLAWIWRPLVAMTVQPDVARAEGLPTGRARVVFILLMALTVGLAMKVVGILLITALLLIPPATARRFARGPEAMAAIAVIAGLASAMFGMRLSFAIDVPTGPAIVASAALLFGVSLVVRRA